MRRRLQRRVSSRPGRRAAALGGRPFPRLLPVLRNIPADALAQLRRGAADDAGHVPFPNASVRRQPVRRAPAVRIRRPLAGAAFFGALREPRRVALRRTAAVRGNFDGAVRRRRTPPAFGEIVRRVSRAQRLAIDVDVESVPPKRFRAPDHRGLQLVVGEQEHPVDRLSPGRRDRSCVAVVQLDVPPTVRDLVGRKLHLPPLSRESADQDGTGSGCLR